MHIATQPSTIAALTSEWQGSRTEDGRPLVADVVLDRLRHATIEQAWQVLDAAGYQRQFAGDWIRSHETRPLVGRAVTAQFLPHRPDFDAAVVKAGAEAGHHEATQQNAWLISMLQAGDVMVADMFGKVKDGTLVGDNLGTAVATRTGTGAVINGGVRDFDGLQELDNANFFCRGIDPSAIADLVLAGVNHPIRIGEATVLPGDIVLGTATGVIFIPAHLAEAVAEASEDIASRDVFGKARIAEGVYTGGEIDVPDWLEHIEADYQAWRSDRANA